MVRQTIVYMIQSGTICNKESIMSETIMEAVGFGEAVKDMKAGRCPLCGIKIGAFRDAISKREYEISGICQTCQDSIFINNKEG